MGSVGIRARVAGGGFLGRVAPLPLDGFRVGDGNDRPYSPAVAGHVGDPAAHGGVIQDIGQRRAQVANPNLNARGRRHTHMLAVVHESTLVYTRGMGSETTPSPRYLKPP
jgi:hypothetical protein